MHKRWMRILFPFLLLMVIIAWMSESGAGYLEDLTHKEHELFAVKIFDGERAEEIECWKSPYEGEYYLFLPSYASQEDCAICLNSGSNLWIEGEIFEKGNSLDGLFLNQEYEFEMELEEEPAVIGKLIIMQSSKLAALFIDTDSGTMNMIHENKGEREKGTYHLITADGGTNMKGRLAHITGRGNATWEWGKKPYGIKMEKQQDLLGMGSGDSWILLANFFDGSYIRNKIVYDLADVIGLKYSPESEFVDLYLNGYYAGVYQLTEKIETGKERVDIGNGYLMEWDITERYLTKENGFVTDKGQAVVLKSPKEPSEESGEYIQNLVQEFEDALYEKDGRNPDTGKFFYEYIDLESWAKKYLIEEVSKNFDSGITSQYFYAAGESEEELLYAGPVWDYDNALGNGDWSVRRPEGMLACYDMRIYDPANQEGVFRNRWFSELYQHKVFVEEVERQYKDCVLPLIHEMLESKIDSYRMEIEGAVLMDKVRWRGEPASPKMVYRETLEEQVDYIKDFLEERTEFLDTVWIEHVDYCTLCFRTEYGTRNLYFSIKRGEVPQKIPGYEESFGGMVFEGWYYDEEYTQRFEPENAIMEDTDVYAKWIPE